MLDQINPLVAQFRMAGEHFVRSNERSKFKLRLIGTRERDRREYNLPTADEVAGLIVGDFDSETNKRDIVLHTQEGGSGELVNYIHHILLFNIRYCSLMVKTVMTQTYTIMELPIIHLLTKKPG